MANQEQIDTMLSDLGKLKDYYTAERKVAYTSPFETDRHFYTAYKEAAEEHGYTVKSVFDEKFNNGYVYLEDNGDVTLYDADVAREAFKTLDMDAVGKEDWAGNKWKPLTDKDFKNSKRLADDVIFVGENKNVVTFEMNPNPAYGSYHHRRALEGSRIMNDEQKQSYIDAINSIDTLDHSPEILKEHPLYRFEENMPLTVSAVYNSLTFVDSDKGELNRRYLVARVQQDFDVNQEDAQDILYNPTDEQKSTIKGFVISDIQKGNAIFNTVTYQTTRDRVLNGQIEEQAGPNPIDRIMDIIKGRNKPAEPEKHTLTEDEIKNIDTTLAPVYKDADKINDYYTAQKVMAGDVDEDTFAKAYKDAAKEHGFEPKEYREIRGYEDPFVYLIDADGNAKTYDADVAKDAFKSIALSGDFNVNDYKALDDKAITNSEDVAGQFHLVGRNHDIPVLDFVDNDVYEFPIDVYESRYLTDEDKELYINAVKNAPDVDNEAMDDSPLSLSAIVQNFDPVYEDAVGNGNGEYFNTIAKEHGLEEDVQTFVYHATPDQNKALREDLIDRIKNDEFVRTAKYEYFNGDVEDKARELGEQDNLDDFLAGLDDLNKNQDNGLQQ